MDQLEQAELILFRVIAFTFSRDAASCRGTGAYPHLLFGFRHQPLAVDAAGIAVALMAYATRRSTPPNVRVAMVIDGGVIGLLVTFPMLSDRSQHRIGA
ncbi:hypothetical protein [Methylorubrum salsuginis]|uniref:hypothetical protein n=1 Tax=Methylorubrum salsuginis TaxID=414703 RepID=UPI000B816E3D|nr:hypothetical protein [Methylorubrum salsuginis]